MSDERDHLDDSDDGRYPYGGRPSAEDEDWRQRSVAKRRNDAGAAAAMARAAAIVRTEQPPPDGWLPRPDPDGKYRCKRCRTEVHGGGVTHGLRQAMYGGAYELCGRCVGQDAADVGAQIREACRAYKAGRDRQDAARQLVDLMGRHAAHEWMRGVDAKAEAEQQHRGGRGGAWS